MSTFDHLDAALRRGTPEADGDGALRAFYGAGNTKRALIGTGERLQEIYTPQPVIDGLLRLWPEGIALDPCSGPASIVPAAASYYTPGRKHGNRTIYEATGDDTDGRALPWAPRTYCNPPFRYLKDWLSTYLAAPREAVIMAPVRVHRTWYREAMRASDETIFLNAGLTFLGYDQAFPAPVALLYRGDRDAAAAFADIGEALSALR